jgi:hypothetical protein
MIEMKTYFPRKITNGKSFKFCLNNDSFLNKWWSWDLNNNGKYANDKKEKLHYFYDEYSW